MARKGAEEEKKEEEEGGCERKVATKNNYVAKGW